MPTNRILGDWLDAFMQYTSNTEPSDQFRLWTGISTVAAALQRKVHLEWGTLTFYPNMYIVLVGPSASRKGTAMKPAADLIEATNIPIAASSTTSQALIRRMGEANHVEHDVATGKVIAHSSLTVFSEFTVFLKAKDSDMMSVLCDWYDCKNRFIHDTKSQGTDEILGVCRFLELRETGPGAYSLLWKRPTGGEVEIRINPVIPEGCTLVTEDRQQQVSPGAVVVRGELRCEGGLKDKLLRIAGLETTITDVPRPDPSR